MKHVVKDIIVPLICVALGAALTSQVVNPWPSWMRWTLVSAVAGLIAYLLAIICRAMLPMMRAEFDRRRVERQIRSGVISTAHMMRDASNRSNTNSVGCVFNTLCTDKRIVPELANAHSAHLHSLVSTVDNIRSDFESGRIDGRAALGRLIESHRSYIRICCEVAVLATGVGRNGISREWDAIRDRGNSVSNCLVDVSNKIRTSADTARPNIYFENIPSI